MNGSMTQESGHPMEHPDPQELLSLNVIKADPVLRLLAAHAGFEDGQVPFLDGWRIFKTFLRIPSAVEDGGGTFQVAGAEADPQVLEVFFGRQLGDSPEFGWSDARVVGLSYVFHPPESGPSVRDYLLDGEEFWSADFGTLEEFFETVEKSEGFRTARSRDLMSVTFYSQEEVTGRSPTDEVE